MAGILSLPTLTFRLFIIHEALVLVLRLFYAHVARHGARGDKGLVQSLAQAVATS